MREKKPVSMVASVNEGIIATETKHSRKFNANARLFALIVGVSTAAIVVVGTVYVLWHEHNHKSASVSDARHPVGVVTQKQSAQYQAVGLAGSGDVSAALKVLSQQIAATTDKSQLSLLYTQKSATENDARLYANGLKDAQSAEAAYPTIGSARLIAQNAELLGDKTLALKYYKIALQRAGPDIYQGENDDLRAKVSELGG